MDPEEFQRKCATECACYWLKRLKDLHMGYLCDHMSFSAEVFCLAGLFLISAQKSITLGVT